MTPSQLIDRFGALPPHLFKTAVRLLAESKEGWMDGSTGRVHASASRLAREEGIDPRNMRERLRELRERKVLVPHPDGYGFRIDPGWNENGCEHPAVERMQTSTDGADADIRNPDSGIPPEDANVRNSDADIRIGGERGGSSYTMERLGDAGQKILLPGLLDNRDEENTRAERMQTSADPDADIREALLDLKAVCGTDFDLTAKTRKLGLALLRHPDKAASLDDFRLVHRHMHRQWKDDRTRPKNPRTSTLWGGGITSWAISTTHGGGRRATCGRPMTTPQQLRRWGNRNGRGSVVRRSTDSARSPGGGSNLRSTSCRRGTEKYRSEKQT